MAQQCGAGPSDKLFVLGGRDGAVSFPGLREALIARGWIEHCELDSPAFDLKWCLKTSEIDFGRLGPGQIVNHFSSNRHVTTKVLLSTRPSTKYILLPCIHPSYQFNHPTFIHPTNDEPIHSSILLISR